MAGSGFSMALGSKPKKPVPAATEASEVVHATTTMKRTAASAAQQQPEFVSEIVDGKVDGKRRWCE